MHPLPLTQGDIPGTHFCENEPISEATVWLEGLNQQNIPMTPSGIKPVKFQLLALCLNQLHHRIPPFLSTEEKFLL
jgi:hypothetical protein